MSTVVKNRKEKCKYCFWRLQREEIVAANAITKNRRKTVVKRKQTTKKVPFNIFRCSEVRKNGTVDVVKPEKHDQREML